MDILTRLDLKSLIADKVKLKRALDEIDKRVGFVPDPTATAEKAQQMMRADGIRPEDNIASREILRMREE
jgi:hypothetical protein